MDKVKQNKVAVKDANRKNPKKFDLRRAARRAKEFMHPANVTWKKPKDTTHDSLVVLGVVVAAAVFLAVGDAVFGVIMGLLL